MEISRDNLIATLYGGLIAAGGSTIFTASCATYSRLSSLVSSVAVGFFYGLSFSATFNFVIPSLVNRYCNSEDPYKNKGRRLSITIYSIALFVLAANVLFPLFGKRLFSSSTPRFEGFFYTLTSMASLVGTILIPRWDFSEGHSPPWYSPT